MPTPKPQQGEALVRRARLELVCGRFAKAAADRGAAEPMLHDSTESLRASAYALACAQLATAAHGESDTRNLAPLRMLLDRLRGIGRSVTHPLTRARMAQVDTLMALAHGAWRCRSRQRRCAAAGRHRPPRWPA